MKQSAKTKVKALVVSIALLLCLALSVGLAGAWYEARRTANGTINMNTGIIIEYADFYQDPENLDDNNIWNREDVEFYLFSTTSAVPGQEIALTPAKIGAATGSVDFYARYKLDYKFYADVNATTEVTGVNVAEVLVASDPIINGAWVLSGDGYYYYATGTTLNIMHPADELVELFADGAKYTVNTNIGGEGYGYEVNGTVVKRIDVILTLEVAQVGVNWAITEILPDPIVEEVDGISKVLQDTSGNVVADIEEGQVYQILDSDLKGLKYEFNLNGASGFSVSINPNSVDGTAIVVGYTGPITDVEIPNYIVVGGKTYQVTQIADYAFEDCSSLTSLSASYSIEYIGADAFTNCTNLRSVDLSACKLTENTTSISMFDGCSSLKEIEAPALLGEGGEIVLPSIIGGKWFDNNEDKEEVLVIGGTTAGQVITLVVTPYLNANWLSLIATDVNGNATGIVKTNVKAVELVNAMPIDQNYNADNYILIGAISADSTEVNDSVVAYYYESEGKYSLAFVGAGGQKIYAPTNSYALFGALNYLEKLEFNNNLETGHVTNMERMFMATGFYETGLELDLTSFDVSNVTNMHRMFNMCKNIKKIDVSGWDVSKVENAISMFYNCTSLTSLDFTGWNLTCASSAVTNFFGETDSLVEIRVFDSMAEGCAIELDCSFRDFWSIKGGDGTEIIEIANGNGSLGVTLILQAKS